MIDLLGVVHRTDQGVLTTRTFSNTSRRRGQQAIMLVDGNPTRNPTLTSMSQLLVIDIQRPKSHWVGSIPRLQLICMRARRMKTRWISKIWMKARSKWEASKGERQLISTMIKEETCLEPHRDNSTQVLLQENLCMTLISLSGRSVRNAPI